MKVLLFVNIKKDENMAFSEEVIGCLKEKGVDYTLCKAEDNQQCVCTADLLGMDAVIVLGGDGTMLHALRLVASSGVPVLGVNIGRLGFLTEVDYKNFCDVLQKFIKGDYYIEERMLLKAITENGKNLMAVNDVCVMGSEHGKIISVSVQVNGHMVEQFTGDGVIVASPTGSTGYSMSAGGPIVSPMANCIVVTPICAHSFNTKPLVLCDTDKITINVREDRTGVAVLDGQRSIEVRKIQIEQNAYKAKFIRFYDYNFFEVLSRKFNNSI